MPTLLKGLTRSVLSILITAFCGSHGFFVGAILVAVITLRGCIVLSLKGCI